MSNLGKAALSPSGILAMAKMDGPRTSAGVQQSNFHPDAMAGIRRPDLHLRPFLAGLAPGAKTWIN